MLDNLPHSEYIDWLAFYSIEPFPEEREDLRTAILASAIIDALTGDKGTSYKKEILSKLDFWRDRDTKPQSPEDVANKLRTIFGALAHK